MHVISATVVRFERGRVVVRFEDGQELVLSKRQLPSGIVEGTVLSLEIFRHSDHQLRRQSIAKLMLKELLDETAQKP